MLSLQYGEFISLVMNGDLLLLIEAVHINGEADSVLMFDSVPTKEFRSSSCFDSYH